jgi:deoxyxylulose-5-phosphate synthase
VLQIALPDEFLEQGSVGLLRQEAGIDVTSIVKKIIVEYIGR